MQQRHHHTRSPRRAHTFRCGAPGVAARLLLLAALACPGIARAGAPGSAFARSIGWPPIVGATTAAGDSAGAVPAPAPARALGVREDRWQHASLSFALTAAGGAAGLEPAPAAIGTLALGVAKELFDARTGHFDFADLASDAAGALLAAVALGAMTR